MNEIIQAVSTVGFPIVAYGAMFWYMMKQNENHRGETNALRESIENNTLAVQRLSDYIMKEGRNND